MAELHLGKVVLPEDFPLLIEVKRYHAHGSVGKLAEQGRQGIEKEGAIPGAQFR